MRTMCCALVAGLLALGCGGDSKATGTPYERSIGKWMPPDAGIPPRRDAGLSAAIDAGGKQCIAVPAVPSDAFPRCSSTTRACVAACASDGDDCRQGCIEADDVPPLSGGDAIACSDCVYRRIIGCIGEGGCEAEVNAFLCCIVQQCAGQGDACISTTCADESEAMFVCGYVSAPSCLPYLEGPASDCFGTGPVERDDAGVADAGGT